MAKKSMIHRDIKRAKLVEKYKEKRLELKKSSRVFILQMRIVFRL